MNAQAIIEVAIILVGLFTCYHLIKWLIRSMISWIKSLIEILLSLLKKAFQMLLTLLKVAAPNLATSIIMMIIWYLLTGNIQIFTNPTALILTLAIGTLLPNNTNSTVT